MSKQKILIVEDAKNIAELVQYNLDKADYECKVVHSGEDALEVLKTKSVDLMVLDVMLPKMDGFEICRMVKGDSKYKNTRVILLTAKGEEIDRIVGLELGADDYIVKPFSPRELVLRVKAILRRSKSMESSEEIYKIGSLVVDIPKHRVTVQEKEVDLTPLEFKLLCTLIERRGRVQTRERLLSDVWQIDVEIDTRTIDTHVKRLREKLGKVGHFIETVRGMGYRFKES